jgi:hypothetical protein
VRRHRRVVVALAAMRTVWAHRLLWQLAGQTCLKACGRGRSSSTFNRSNQGKSGSGTSATRHSTTGLDSLTHSTIRSSKECPVQPAECLRTGAASSASHDPSTTGDRVLWPNRSPAAPSALPGAAGDADAAAGPEPHPHPTGRTRRSSDQHWLATLPRRSGRRAGRRLRRPRRPRTVTATPYRQAQRSPVRFAQRRITWVGCRCPLVHADASTRSTPIRSAHPSAKTLFVDVGYWASIVTGRTGRRSRFPPQFGQSWSANFSMQPRHHVHSNVQMYASPSGARSRSQHSQFGRICNITTSGWRHRHLRARLVGRSGRFKGHEAAPAPGPHSRLNRVGG